MRKFFSRQASVHLPFFWEAPISQNHVNTIIYPGRISLAAQVINRTVKIRTRFPYKTDHSHPPLRIAEFEGPWESGFSASRSYHLSKNRSVIMYAILKESWGIKPSHEHDTDTVPVFTSWFNWYEHLNHTGYGRRLMMLASVSQMKDIDPLKIDLGVLYVNPGRIHQ